MIVSFDKPRIDLLSESKFPCRPVRQAARSGYGDPLRQGHIGQPERTSQAPASWHEPQGISRTFSQAVWSGLKIMTRTDGTMLSCLDIENHIYHPKFKLVLRLGFCSY